MEDPYEIEVSKANSTWKISFSNRAAMEEGEFEERLYDYIEDFEIWLELVFIKEEERINPISYGCQLVWNTVRGSYKTEESMGIWALKDMCEGEYGTIYLNGGEDHGKYYRVERRIMRSLANEMVCIASARLEWQDIERYGEPLREGGEDMEDEASEEYDEEEENEGSEGENEIRNQKKYGARRDKKKGDQSRRSK